MCCQYGLEFFADRAAGLREMARVLVPGGRLVLRVWRALERQPFYMALFEALERHVRAGAAAPIRAAFTLADMAELRALVAGAGLRTVHIRITTNPIRYPSLEEYVMRYLSATPIARDVVAMDETARTALLGACLQLSADLLGGAVEITGSSRNGEIRHTLWGLWLELYLVPAERVPATIPIHRITGVLEISGRRSEEFDEVSLETVYEIPPDILRLLHGRSNRPRQITVTDPMTAVLVAYCQTPEWGPSSQPHEDRIRVNLEVAEADYQTLEVVAPLRRLEYTGSTEWRVEQN